MGTAELSRMSIYFQVQSLQTLQVSRAQGFRHGDTRTSMVQHSDLRHNAKGNLLWCASAEVKANRGTYTQQFFGGNPLFVQEFEDGPDAALAANHTDIGGRTVNDGAQTRHMMRVRASKEDNMRARG